jgi:hypothetical protein
MNTTKPGFLAEMMEVPLGLDSLKALTQPM